MKLWRKLVLFSALIPLLGWLGSLAFHFYSFRDIFVWNDVAYLPLLVLTAPLEFLYDSLNIKTHAGMFGYAMLAAIVYAAATALILLPMVLGPKKHK